MRNTFILILTILVIRCYSVPVKRQRNQNDDEIAEAVPVLDNNQSGKDQSEKDHVRQDPDEKVKNKAQKSTEKPNDKNEHPIKKKNHKYEKSTEKVVSTKESTSTEKLLTNKTLTEKPKVETKEIPNQSTSANKTLPVIAHTTTDQSDEELTGLFSGSENPGPLERFQQMWQDLRNMMFIIELWNKVRDFIKNWTGLDLS